MQLSPLQVLNNSFALLTSTIIPFNADKTPSWPGVAVFLQNALIFFGYDYFFVFLPFSVIFDLHCSKNYIDIDVENWYRHQI